MEIKKYIESGVLEAYVIGAASENEAEELLQLKKIHPRIERALNELEADMERLASYMAVTPPPRLWNRIEENFNELVISPDLKPLRKVDDDYKQQPDNEPQYISVEAETTHMRIHKAWKWVFAAVFILGKIFLGFAIYFYLENRQAQQQIQEIKTEIKARR